MRRRKRRSRNTILVVIAAVGIVGGWWFWPRSNTASTAQPSDAMGSSMLAAPSGATVPEAVVAADTSPDSTPDEVLTPSGPAGSDPGSEVEPPTPEPLQTIALANQTASEADTMAAQLSSNPRVNASLRLYNAGRVLEARQELNRMLVISNNASEQAEIRRHLAKIADETIFSRQPYTDDPRTEIYTIQPGDVLVNIGKQYNVPHEIIMSINGIAAPERIQAGQRVKVPHGPFNARIYKSDFRLDVYLQDLYVRSYPVGLGAEQSTPEGEWQVKERLPNPTYYPPASAEGKRIIAPDDPDNPLGEHWIGLEGIGGDALGRVGYGIHGTIEPEAIGRAVSLGCIRMRNDDVAVLYGLMMPGQSKVTILP